MDASGREPVALTIAGSDSSGGAGIQADLKAFAALGIYGASVVTAVTAQNTVGVQGVLGIDAAFVIKQIDSVMADLNVVAAKTGMLGTSAVVQAVAVRLGRVRDLKLVVDPVMVATSGDLLLTGAAIGTYRAHLMPLATLVTPNLPEAARLLATTEAVGVDEAVDQAKALVALGCSAVLVKGGHGRGREIVDVLCIGEQVFLIRHDRIETANTHGTGCTLSAAITAALAQGASVEDAVRAGVNFVSRALVSGKHRRFGAGHGPVDPVNGV